MGLTAIKKEKRATSIESVKSHYELLFNFSLDLLAVVGFDGYFETLNPAWEKTLGWTRRELKSKPYIEFVHPEDREATLKAAQSLAEGRTLAGFRNRYRCKDGSYKWLSWSAFPHSEKKWVFAVARDVTKIKELKETSRQSRDEMETEARDRNNELAKTNRTLQKVNRALRMLSECNEILIHADEETSLLNKICNAVVEVGGYRFTWVGYAEQDESKTVRPAAWAGQEEGYLQAIRVSWADTQPGRGPVGTAIRTGKPSIIGNAATNPDFALWRAEALKRGYAAVMALPLTSDSNTFGALSIYSSEDTFDTDEVRLLDELANDLAYGIRALRTRAEHKRADEAFRESQALLAGFFDSPGAMNGIIEVAHDDILHIADNGVAAAFFGRTREAMQNRLASEMGISIYSIRAWLDRCDESRDTGKPTTFEYVHYDATGERWLSVTLSYLGPGAGQHPRFAYVMHDITEHKNADRKIRNQLKKLAALRDIDMAITSSLDIRVSMKVILEEVVNTLQVDAADILLLNATTNTLEYIGSRGFRTSALQHTRLRLGEGLAGRAALDKRPVHIRDLSAEEHTFTRSPHLAEEGFVEYYAVPLISKGHVRGVLEIFHRGALDVDQDWVNFLDALGTQSAIAIDNTEMFNELERSNVELSIAYETTLEGWSRALDYRDKETEGHSRRVTETAVKIAQAMGMNSEELVHARRGALLHDIGKLGIPDSILLKPGKLTEEEMEVIKKHPILALELLSPIPFLKNALDIPYCHHEKWNGTGYPRGLKGEQIPLAARIFSVVDVYDALMSDRPYRPAWSKEKTTEYIRGLAGIQFDPAVVDKFFKMDWGKP